MDWTEETISRLRSLWQEGLSTAEIGRRMSITKNAVVGKAHRLTLPARPSPIRKGMASPDAASQPGCVPSLRVAAFVPRPAAQQKQAEDGSGETSREIRESRGGAANVTPLRVVAAPRPELAPKQLPVEPVIREEAVARSPAASVASRSTSYPSPRRHGQSCCWPSGEPGTKQFRFCGGEPIPGKPYCSEHAQLAYVKLRDRRDTVA